MHPPQPAPKPPAAAPAPPAAPAPVAPPVTALPPAPPEVAPPPAPVPAVPAWRRNAAAFTPVPGRPMIALVIDDMGVDVRRSAEAMALPPAATLSFLAYARDVARQSAAARARGHELLLHLPMEPLDRSADPGPGALLTAMSRETIVATLRRDLAAFSGYVGVNNHMGSRFTASAEAMTPVLEEFKADGLLFLDSLTSGRSVGAKLAESLGVPTLKRDVFIDDSPDPGAIRTQLARAEAIAKRTGRVVMIGHPRDGTLAALRAWMPAAEAAGFQFVPLSALVRAKSGGR